MLITSKLLFKQSQLSFKKLFSTILYLSTSGTATYSSSTNNSTQNKQSESFNKVDYIDIGLSKNKVKQNYGKLTVCPTPIGNLKDITIRQYEALLNADIIACEDTRVTGLLLTLIKQKKLKQSFSDSFGVADLKELKTDKQQEEYDDSPMLDLMDIKEGKMDVVQDQGSTKVILSREARILQKIKEIRAKSRQILMEKDSLNIYKDKPLFSENEENINQDQEGNNKDYYGLEDEYIKFLKLKIKQTKEKKNRGIMISYHKHNEELRIDRLIKLLLYGLNITLVSDAGTPTISDPGYLLVDKCIKQGIIIDSLPGSTSITVALSSSGFPSDRFIFEGYLSKTQSDKEEKLEKIRNQKLTCVLFESPKRLLKTLLSIEKFFGEKQIIFVAIEMTKLHEKYYRQPVRQLYDQLNDPEKTKLSFIKGEITIVIPPYTSLYNQDLYQDSQTQSQDSSNQDKQTKKMEDSKESDENFYKVQALTVANILNEKLDITDNNLANLLSDILRVSRTKAYNIIKQVRHKQKRKEIWDELLENPYLDEKKRNL